MEREGARDVEELLAYSEDTAGGLMTTEYVAVREDLTAQQCIEELRRMEPDAESIYYVFVVDAEEHLKGVLSLRELIVAPPGRPIRELMHRHVVAVQADEGKEEVAAVLSKYNLLAVPVVDDEFRIQGVVTVDDALDAVLPDSVKRKLPRAL
jgi:magnesium transporter